MDTQQIKCLLEQTKVALDDFESTQAETSRIKAREQALKLAGALERPRDAILRIAYTVRMSCLIIASIIIHGCFSMPYIND